ncbi:MAG: HD domain-containing protein [Promethearchaeota archaeon]
MSELGEAPPQTSEYEGFTINLPPQVKEAVDEYARKFLEKGRGDFDPTHTEAAVYYALLIGSYYGLDPAVLYTSARCHDIGYAGHIERDKAHQFVRVEAAKADHMEVGAERVRTFLEREDIKDHYTQAQKDLIIHLVLVHDRVEDLKTLYEIIIMEADTLAAISLNALDHITVITTFSLKDREKYIKERLKKRRYLHFKTYPGKLFLQVLAPAFQRYHERQLEIQNTT